MNVDIAALRAIERDKDIPFETVLEAIETALLTAYNHTDGHQPHARVDIDRKTGAVRVLARDTGDDDEPGPEWDDTPEGFGRIPPTAGDRPPGGAPRPAGATAPGVVLVALSGGIEGVLPQAEQVPGERYAHGERLRCYVVGVTRGARGTQITLSRTHPNLVRKLFALEVPELVDGSVEIVAVAREAGHRTKIAVRATVSGVNPAIGKEGQNARLAARLTGWRIDIRSDADPRGTGAAPASGTGAGPASGTTAAPAAGTGAATAPTAPTGPVGEPARAARTPGSDAR